MSAANTSIPAAGMRARRTSPSIVRIGRRIVPAIFLLALWPLALRAQGPVTNPQILPAAPTSLDMVYLSVPGRCTAAYRSPAFAVKLAGTRITVTQRLTYPPPPCPAPPIFDVTPMLQFEIGRLPAGTYAVDVVESSEIAGSVVESTVHAGLPLVVAARAMNATTPQPLVNYSGHWWDPADSGSGFMIYQSGTDAVLAAWFTYGFDGSPTWYTLQGGSWVSSTRYVGTLMQVSRPPGPIAPAGSGASVIVNIISIAGTATLDFSGNDGINSGVFTATLSAVGQVSRNIRRFGK